MAVNYIETSELTTFACDGEKKQLNKYIDKI